MSRSDKFQLAFTALIIIASVTWWSFIVHGTNVRKEQCRAAGGVPVVSVVFAGQEVTCFVGKVIDL